MSEKCVLPLGYQGNNLLCSNWDRESLDKLDYNGIYEYFYGMKYDRRFEPEQYPHGIPAEEFEETIIIPPFFYSCIGNVRRHRCFIFPPCHICDENERKEAEADLRAALELTRDIYQEADKGDASKRRFFPAFYGAGQ